MTASSIFKASLPSEAQATNRTSEAGQDGIHRAHPPLISPSAANQAHHIAAVCLLTAARAKKVNSRTTGVDGNILAGWCGSSPLCFWSDFPLSERSLSPGRHLSLLAVIRMARQLRFLLLFLQKGQLCRLSLHARRR